MQFYCEIVTSSPRGFHHAKMVLSFLLGKTESDEKNWGRNITVKKEIDGDKSLAKWNSGECNSVGMQIEETFTKTGPNKVRIRIRSTQWAATIVIEGCCVHVFLVVLLYRHGTSFQTKRRLFIGVETWFIQLYSPVMTRQNEQLQTMLLPLPIWLKNVVVLQSIFLSRWILVSGYHDLVFPDKIYPLHFRF